MNAGCPRSLVRKYPVHFVEFDLHDAAAAPTVRMSSSQQLSYLLAYLLTYFLAYLLPNVLVKKQICTRSPLTFNMKRREEPTWTNPEHNQCTTTGRVTSETQDAARYDSRSLPRILKKPHISTCAESGPSQEKMKARQSLKFSIGSDSWLQGAKGPQ